MRLRNSRVRVKVTALLVSLIALWGFAAWVTTREGLNVLWVSALDSGVAVPGERLRDELQRERRLTVVLLADPGSGARRAALSAQRRRTDNAVAEFGRLTTSDGTRAAAGETLLRRIDQANRQAAVLPGLRKLVDAGAVDRAKAAQTITAVIEALYKIYDSMATLDDAGFAKDTRTFIQLSRALELLAQEDAIAAGALIAGGFTDGERARFAGNVGAQRFLMNTAAGELPPLDRADYDRFTSGEAYERLRRLEERIIESPRAESPAVDAETWEAATTDVLAQLDRLITVGGDRLVERATPIAIGVIVRLALAGGLGLIAVIASIVLAITTARALVRRLEELRAAALDLAARRLPSVVDRLGRGEDVDVAAEAPPLAVGSDAIGQVGQAFNTVQETAVRVAVQQAEMRRGYRAILLSLARRTQSLVHRQLTVLDTMEKRESDPAELADLFRVDHLATRMRRNAENLIVLSGASPGRAWRRSVPMVDVVRGALAEIEDYTQVELSPMDDADLAGRAIGDVIHLLAELIENAVSFSPPYATVRVSGQVVGKGYVVEIEDRGLGMSQEDLAAANQRIADPPEFKLTDTPRLGLFVVSRLAARHRIQVTLKSSPYGGTTVIVLLPRELIGPDPDAPDGPGVPAGDQAPPRQDRGDAPGGSRRADPWRLQDERSGRGREPRPDLPRGPGRQPEPDITPEGPEEPRQEEAGGERAVRAVRAVRSHDAAPPFPQAAQPLPPSQSNGPERPRHAAPQPPAPTTPSGLPRRVAQSHLAPGLRAEPPARPAAPAEPAGERTPEETRRMLAAFQSGTERGRAEAARPPHPDHGDPGEGA
ncbi:nitrate- and nitrite sensing domain-containing protein [Sphaerisporangium sp. B11E5]|uniref:sensor histidine kinase n=1 Tax=Sphaerisporangium sp. B11E5 TaxID=3153563 RepID=UPI00325F3A94